MSNSKTYGLKIGDLVMWNKMAPGRRDMHACGLVTANRGDGNISVLIEDQTFDILWNEVVLVIPPSDSICGVVHEA